MEIPYQALAPETLRRLAEEYVSREGTDYGAREASWDRKIEDILTQLEKGKAKIVFDPETESCDIREAQEKTPEKTG